MQIKIAKFGSLNGTFGSIIDKGISARSWFEILKTSKHTSAYTQNMCVGAKSAHLISES